MNRHFCADCDSPNLIRFEDETFSIDHTGLATEIKGLSGWRCTACGQIEFDTGSAQRYAAGGDELVLRTRIRKERNPTYLPVTRPESNHSGPFDRRRTQRLLTLRTRRGCSPAGGGEPVQI